MGNVEILNNNSTPKITNDANLEAEWKMNLIGIYFSYFYFILFLLFLGGGGYNTKTAFMQNKYVSLYLSKIRSFVYLKRQCLFNLLTIIGF